MHGSPLLLLTANGLEFAVGMGIVVGLGLASGRRAVLARLGLAYGAGLAAVGILDANLALVGVVLALPELGALAAGSLVAGSYLGSRHRRYDAAGADSSIGAFVASGAGVATAALLGLCALSFSVRPLLGWDGWATWALKAQALYDFGSAAPVLTSAAYSQPSYSSSPRSTASPVGSIARR